VGKCAAQNSRLQTLYLASVAAQNLFAVPSGMLFDHQGPRVTGVLGLVAATIGLAGVFFSLSFPAFEAALFFFVPLLQLGQNVGSWGVFGFIFFYSKHVGLLTGIANSSFLLSSVQMYVIIALVNSANVSLRIALLYLFACSVVASVISFACPTMTEYEASFSNSFGHAPQPRRSFLIIIRQLFRVFKLRPKQTLSYFAASAATNISFSFWMGSVFAFNSFNIGQTLAESLAADSAILYAVIGVLASPLTGFIFDKAGFFRQCFFEIAFSRQMFFGNRVFADSLFFASQIGVLRYSVFFLIVQCVATALIWPPLYSVQMLVSVIMFSLYSLWLTFESKLPAIFAPPDLYGSYLGFSNSLSGILQLVLNLIIPPTFGAFGLAGKWFYLAPVLLLMTAGVFFLLFFVLSLVVSPAPETPPQLEEAQSEEAKLLINPS
jgi:hypothetical protein